MECANIDSCAVQYTDILNNIDISKVKINTLEYTKSKIIFYLTYFEYMEYLQYRYINIILQSLNTTIKPLATYSVI